MAHRLNMWKKLIWSVWWSAKIKNGTQIQNIFVRKPDEMSLLRRLLKFDLDIYKLFDVYTKEIRSLLELAVPVWHSGLTRDQKAHIERIQKVAMQIILQDKFINYQLACNTFSADTLENRRTNLCTTFARRNYQSENYLFTKVRTTMDTRKASDIVMEYKCNFGRYQKSSHTWPRC